MTAAVDSVATWINSSLGTKLSSPTNSVSRASRELSFKCSHNSSSARVVVMYWPWEDVVTRCSFCGTIRPVGRPHRFYIAQAQILFQKLIGFQNPEEFRFGAAVSIVGVRMELLGFEAKGCRDIGERTAEFKADDRIRIHRIVHPAGALREIAASAGRFQHIGQADFLAAAPGTFPNFAIEFVPSILDKLQAGFKTHGTGQIANNSQLVLNFDQRPDDFFQSLFHPEETVDSLFHHGIDGQFKTAFGFRSQ